MKCRKIIWKRRRDSYQARALLWMTLPVKGPRDATTFWAKEWVIK